MMSCTVFQCLNACFHILCKFFIGISGIPCIHPDFARSVSAFSAAFQPFLSCDAGVDGTGSSFMHMENLPLTLAAPAAHGSITLTGLTICPAYTETGGLGGLILLVPCQNHRQWMLNPLCRLFCAGSLLKFSACYRVHTF